MKKEKKQKKHNKKKHPTNNKEQTCGVISCIFKEIYLKNL